MRKLKRIKIGQASELLTPPKPTCFGAYPIGNPVEQVENCCHDCPFNHSCFEKMAQDNPPPWME